MLILMCLGYPAQPAYSQALSLQLSGQVTDPRSGAGIPGVYVALEGVHATSFMGGTEYMDDLVLDSTDAKGRWHLQIARARIDSFILKNHDISSIFRFALDVRSERSHNFFERYNNYYLLSRFLPIDTAFSFYDRNYVDEHTFILTDKNHRIQKDTAGFVVPFYKGGMLRFLPGDPSASHDTSFPYHYALHVVVQELSKKDGAVLREDGLYIDRKAPDKGLLLQPYLPMRITISLWYRDTGKEDTLTVINNLLVQPGQVKEVRLVYPAAIHARSDRRSEAETVQQYAFSATIPQ